MKPVAIFVAGAAFAAISVAAQAETVNANQAKSADDKSVAAVAGPDAAARTADRRQDMHEGHKAEHAAHKDAAVQSGQSAPAKPKHTDPN